MSALGPIDVFELDSDVTAIEAGGGQNCAVRTSNSVRCWGNNYAGQLGLGFTTKEGTQVKCHLRSDSWLILAAPITEAEIRNLAKKKK